MLISAFVWKVGTELLRPMVGEPTWEFIERGGSYAAPLALLYVRRWADDPAIEGEQLAPTRQEAVEGSDLAK